MTLRSSLARTVLMLCACALQHSNARLWYTTIVCSFFWLRAHEKNETSSEATFVATCYIIATLWDGKTDTYTDGAALAVVCMATAIGNSSVPDTAAPQIALAMIAAAVAASPNVRLLVIVCIVLVGSVCVFGDANYFAQASAVAALLIFISSANSGVGTDFFVCAVAVLMLGVALKPE